MLSGGLKGTLAGVVVALPTMLMENELFRLIYLGVVAVCILGVLYWLCAKNG
jgi:hypothetical protein